MGKASVEVKFEFPDLAGLFFGNYQRIERVIAATVQTQVGLRFDAEGAHNGHPPWKPIKRKGQILSLTGTLRKSISPPGANGMAGPEGFVRSDGDASDLLVEVGTMVRYASVHNNGAVIKHPGTADGFGRGIPIPPHDIPIAKRPFTDLNEQDNQELSETVANLVAAILEGN